MDKQYSKHNFISNDTPTQIRRTPGLKETLHRVKSIGRCARNVLLLPLLFASIWCSASITIKGCVVDQTHSPIPGANVIIEGSYSGASTDGQGCFSFSFTTNETSLTILAGALGFEQKSYRVAVSDTIVLSIWLKEVYNELDAVVITAGSFSASDDQQSAELSAHDVYTSPASQGDLLGAIRTLPGAQPASATGQLLVRGGDATESATYMDGALAGAPYESSTPDLPSRSSFDSNLFSGIQFSSGGYSARYGQSLSSVLQLQSKGVASEDLLALSLTTTGVSASSTFSGKRQSLGLSTAYSNLTPYHSLAPSSLDYTKPMEAKKASLVYRLRPSKTGLVKAFLTAGNSQIAYQNETYDTPFSVSLQSNNYYANVQYRDQWSDRTAVQLSLSSTYKQEALAYSIFERSIKNQWHDGRFAVVHDLGRGNVLRYGVCTTYSGYNRTDRVLSDTLTYQLETQSTLVGTFTELNIAPFKWLALRIGGRYEHNPALQQSSLAPRIAAATSLGSGGQLSVAWGHYYQTPDEEVLVFDKKLELQRAEHLIVNYKLGKASTRLFRAEAYRKTYDHLVTYHVQSTSYFVDCANAGTGIAKGLDLFFSDKKSIKGLEYNFSYSYIDTKRKYKDYRSYRTPDFISSHSFSTIAKYWVPAINTQLGASYLYSSPKTYVNDRSTAGEIYKTNRYMDFSVNASYIFYIGEHYSVLHGFVSNVLNRKNILGYRYNTSIQNNYSSPVMVEQTNPNQQFFFLGLFLTL